MTRWGSGQVGNTDAEGRLILADALADADAEMEEDGGDSCHLILDFATLTGAARVATGTEIGAVFSNDSALARGLQDASWAPEVSDPLWAQPLAAAYRSEIKSEVADVRNIGSGGPGGHITAALYLQSFLRPRQTQTPWVHVDMMAFNRRGRPGRPAGGEAMGMRAAFAWLKARYGPSCSGP